MGEDKPNIYKLQTLGIAPDGSKYKAVIIDDSKIVRKKLKQILLSFQFNILDEIDNGDLAIKRIKKDLLKPDFIFLDIEMPYLDGIATLKELKPIMPDCKFIMVTSHGEKGCVEVVTQIGVDGYIRKPFDRETIQALLYKIFGY